MFLKNKKGFTLLELIITMLILSLVTLTGVQLMKMFAKAGAITMESHNIQNTARVTASTVKTSIMNASSIFLLNDTAFFPENHTEGWSYIGIERVGNCDEIVHYEYDSETKLHNRMVLGKGNENSYIELVFNKSPQSERKVNVNFTSYKNNQKEVLIDTSFESLNAYTVVDWASGNGASAFAYRKEEFLSDSNIKYAENLLLGFALDISGSMEMDFDTDKYIDNRWNDRSYHLRNAVTKLMKPFENHPNVWATGTAYFSTVLKEKVFTKPYQFVGSDLLHLKHLFSPEDYALGNQNYTHFLSPTGSTNSGDGLRILYYQMLDHEDKLPKTAGEKYNKIIILITDGVNNCETVISGVSNYPYPFYFNRGFANEQANNNGMVNYSGLSSKAKILTISGEERTDSKGQRINTSDEYIYQLSRIIADSGDIEDAYFISLITEVPSLNKLGTIFGYGHAGSEEHGKHVFNAKNAKELDFVVDTIIEDITVSFEYILGPKR